MITTAFINMSFIILNYIVQKLPQSTGFPTSVHDSVSFIGKQWGLFDPLVDRASLAIILALLFTFEVTVFGFYTVRWIMSHIPLFGGKGN